MLPILKQTKSLPNSILVSLLRKLKNGPSLIDNPMMIRAGEKVLGMMKSLGLEDFF